MGNRYTDVFRGHGLDEELSAKGLDLRYFSHIPNASVAQDALDLVLNPAAIATLHKVHTETEIAQMKRSVFRACIQHGVALPSRAVVEARMLGVVVP